MAHECFEVGEDGGVAHIKMCRPQKANSMNEAFWREFPQVLDMLDRRGEVRVCVLSGTGRNFCGGMDLSFFAKEEFVSLDNARKREVIIDLVAKLQGVFNRIERVRFPVIAAVQGACIGGALDMIAACDLRYASREARFFIEEINIGMMADLGSLQRLPLLMPEGVVREMAYTGQGVSAMQALEYGLVNRVFENHEDMMGEVMKIAEQIASKPPLAISASKKAFNFSRNSGLRDALDHAGVLQGAMLDPLDIAESMKAKAASKEGEFANLLPLLTGRDKGQ